MSRRARRGRAAQTPSPDLRASEAALTASGGQWPPKPDDLDAVLTQCLEAVFATTTPDEVLTLLLRAPRPSQEHLSRALGLPKTTQKLNRGMASTLLNKLQNRVAPSIAIHLVTGFLQSFDSTRLDREEWTRLLTADSADIARLAADCPDLREAMEDLGRFPASGYAHGLIVAALSSPYWLPALALLAFDNEKLAAAYLPLRAEQPDLPESVRSLADLIQLVTTQAPKPETIEPAEFVDDPDSLRAAAQKLDWEEAAAVASRMADLLAAGEAPELAETESLDEFVRRTHKLADRLTLATQTLVDASVTGIAAALDTQATEQSELRQVGALIAATAPQRLVEQLEQVRTLAKSALAGDEPAEVVSGLAALAELAEIGRRPESTDFDTIDSLVDIVHAGLPQATHRLIGAAHHGLLVLEPGRQDDNDATSQSSTGSTSAAPGDDPAIEEALDGETSYEADQAADLGVHEQAGLEVGDEPAEAVGGGDDCLPTGGVAGGQVGGGGFDLGDFDRYLQGSTGDRDRGRGTAGVERPAGLRAGTAVVDADDEAQATDDHDGLRKAETVLLSSERFGTASLLHRTQAHAAARRLAAYQAHLTSPTGDLASAFAEDQPLITRDALSSDQPGQLLAWAAAARVSILAPASAAAQILIELARRVDDYQGLKEFGTELATASLNGAIAVADRGERLEAEQLALAKIQVAIREARNLLTVAPQRTVKYAPANNVYKRWMSADGELGRLLAMIVDNEPGTVGAVQSTIVDLRRTPDRLIDATFAQVTSTRTRGRRIEAGARQSLVKRMDEALAIAGSWVESVTTAAELHDQARSDSWSQRPLERLRSALPELRGKVIEDLARLKDGYDQASPDGRYALAAVKAADGMLAKTFEAIDGRPPRGPEPTPAWVVRSELLGQELALEPHTLQIQATLDPSSDQSVLACDAARRLAARGPADLNELYLVRSKRNEHDLTEIVVSEALRSDPATGAQLLVQRDLDVTQTQAAVDLQLKGAIDNVNSRRRDETLPESVWSVLLADLEALRRPGRRDFAAIQDKIVKTAALVDEHCSKLIEEEKRRIEAKAQEDPLVAQHRDKLMAIIARGDVTGAEEYLERLTAGGQEPPTSRTDDHYLKRFFPAVPNLVSANPRFLDNLRAVFAGHEPGGQDVQDLFEITDRDPSQDTDTDTVRSAATVALGAWKSVAEAGRGRGQKGTHSTSAIRSILGALGLEFEGEVELEKQLDDRRFGTVRCVKGTRKAMTPALGSHVGGPGNDSLQILLVWKTVSPATLLDWLDGRENTVLVLYLAGALTTKQRRALATAARGRPNPIAVVVDAAVLAYLVCQPEPSRSTLAFVTLPFTAASPYWESPGNTPPEMFYGRVDELTAVRDLRGSSFVSGGRQLGKSALLRAALHAFDNVANKRAFLVDIRREGADGNPEAVWSRIAAEMRTAEIGNGLVDPGAATAESVTTTISYWLRENSGRSLLILLDEADNFLQADAEDNRFVNVGACKQLMERENHRVKFVFAGLHRTSRFSSLSNQPLAHLGEPIIVGPLRAQAAQDLITRPMAAMGFTFEDAPSQTARILAATNSVPSLLQLFGRTLIEDLIQREVGRHLPQQVSDDDITRVLDNQDLTDLFRTKYALTLNLDHRYQVIVHAIALAAHDHGIDNGLRLSELAEECRQYWPSGFADLSIDYLHGLVTECRDLGLLTLDEGRYRMRTPYVLRLLGTADDIAEVLYDAENRLTLPSSLDAGSYRDLIPDTELHSPLTTRQVGRLFRQPELNRPGRTHLVVGTAALGVDRISRYLEKYHYLGRAGKYDVQSIAAGTPEGLLSAAGRVTQPTMLLVDLRTATSAQATAILNTTAKAHEATRQLLILVIVLTPAALPSWLHEDDDLVALSRVDKPGIELWCDESDATFSTSDERRDLLVATGGWPVLVEKVLTRSSDGRPLPPTNGLARLREHLQSSAGAKELVDACGLGVGSPVSAALAAVFGSAAVLADVAPTRRDDLADLIGEDPDVTDLVTRAGLQTVAEVLRALEIVGAVLTANGDADLVVTEPVLTAAYRIVQQTRALP